MRTWLRNQNRLAILVLGAMVLSATGCQDLEIHTSSYSPDRIGLKILEGKYYRIGGYYYVNLSTLRGGWQGWKERYLSRDALLDAQIVLRLPAATLGPSQSKVDPLEGYVFLGSSLGRVVAWRVASGEATASLRTRKLEISLKLGLEPVYPEERVRRHSSNLKLDTLSLKRVKLESDARVPSLILSPDNTRIVPSLKEWKATSTAGSL
jgi:hypothetical protein